MRASLTKLKKAVVDADKSMKAKLVQQVCMSACLSSFWYNLNGH